jgi:hypothetical protein
VEAKRPEQVAEGLGVARRQFVEQGEHRGRVVLVAMLAGQRGKGAAGLRRRSRSMTWHQWHVD